MTGESVDWKKVGDTITSAAWSNQNGSIDYQQLGWVRMTSSGVRLVEIWGLEAPIAALAIKFFILHPNSAELASLSALGWYFLWWEPRSTLSSVAVRSVACPCAGLATPIISWLGTGKDKNGILIKSGQALEAAYQLDTIVLGRRTITVSKPGLTDLLPLVILSSRLVCD